MIRTFCDDETERIFNRYRSRKFGSIERAAFRRLRAIDAARLLTDLKHPPGNHLEALQGSRKGTYSIRINDQWRICFEWREPHAYNVEIVDYH
ncbi:MAG TPA: type II toxin-antitoxin system RelE/ParE family toxin [Acidobacteriaceae bacterium]|nr:type II toxin-antitoxin system RelE/ParE family toxin [Acidobacteriaceae bacterium]